MTKNDRRSTVAMWDDYAQRLMVRLAAAPRFAGVIRICARDRDPGIDEWTEWQIWTHYATTSDQLRIEDQLDHLVEGSSSILHIGAGNSSLGRRFAPRVARVVATTRHDEERTFAEGMSIENYVVLTANKFSDDMDRIEGQFDFIVDNNPSSFACCIFHFSRMLTAYMELLARNGGLLLTAQPGLGWVCPGNDPRWSLQWDDWALLGEILQMPVRRVTDFVYAMQRIPERGTESLMGWPRGPVQPEDQ
jgi:hypothetical protein